MTVDGIDLLFVAAGFLLLVVCEHCWRWAQRDRERRIERLRRRGLA